MSIRNYKIRALLGALAIAGGAVVASAMDISGAGATFPYPVYSKWAEAYKAKTGDGLNYQSIGSGGGIQQVKSHTVDFGASDAPLSDDQLKEMPPVIQIPETAGPVCITYNLPQLTQPLQLSADALAGIFLGTVKSWKDPVIAKENPGVNLPAQPIVVIHRADGSGTTNAFTTYLSAVSPDWQSKVGKGNSVAWPVGIGGKGSEGVTGQLRQAPGAIGYVELTYAEQNKLPVAKIKNQAGSYVAPTAQSTTAAINAFTTQLSQDPRIPIVNPPATAADAYPISARRRHPSSRGGCDSRRH